jgi:hypothetical protein
MLANIYVCINLENVSGESIKCYVCNSQMNAKCADTIDRSGLEPMECTKPVLEEATSTLKKGAESLGNLFGIKAVPEGADRDLKFACQKIDVSGKRLLRYIYKSYFL